MLKKIIFKGKSLPVPVPVLNLDAALEWIEATLVPAGHTLTKVILDHNDLTDQLQSIQPSKILLSADSVLEIKVDSPRDLALQTLESIYELCRCVYKHLKPSAVECWELTANKPHPSLTSIADDINLVIALTDHLIHLIDSSRIEAAPVQGLVRLIVRVNFTLTRLIKAKNWRETAILLLTRLEPLLKELIKESEMLQVQIFAANSGLDKHLLEVGSG